MATDNATGLEVVFDYVKSISTGGRTFMGNTPPDVSGLVREVVESPGPPIMTMGLGIAVERQRIDIGTRGDAEDYWTPRNELIRIRHAIATMGDYSSRGLVIVGILPTSGIRSEGRDANKREQFSAAFDLWYGEADGT